MDLEQSLPLNTAKILAIQKKHALEDGSMLSKADIIILYKQLAGTYSLKPFNENVVKQLLMKPVRTSSGVAPVTVLTKPFFCPGNCLFCPSDVRMPKSYLASEPGAQRAEHNFFDPYLQVNNRLRALFDMGHPIDKVELIVLGGSWSVYPRPYRIWFIKECFRAMNEFPNVDESIRIQHYYQQKNKEASQQQKRLLSNDSQLNEQFFSQYQPHGLDPENSPYNRLVKVLFDEAEKLVGLRVYQQAKWSELEQAQIANETAGSRCVGLVLETRPDLVDEREVKELRRLGATKIQLGIQSLNDPVLKANRRGHSVAQSAQAVGLLRMAGFKIHLHWMPNLYSSNPAMDKQDYEKLFSDPHFCPDELKIYPCSLLESAGLMKIYQEGLWKPYEYQELLDVLVHCMTHTPEYCRVTRMIRDIPSNEIVVGNKKSNFRQLVQDTIKRQKLSSLNIRDREIRNQPYRFQDVYLDDQQYQTNASEEHFLQYVVDLDGVKRLLGFLRLSLPKKPADNFVETLVDCAIIREVHVYGQASRLGQGNPQLVQHQGWGTQLINRAKHISKQAGFKKLAVISAVGTREYYRQRGFRDVNDYQIVDLG
ncbi:MAG TPA: tRNA uridine(34) 5-carboxymethylaminomethyl modification radical SAM/GNAT enzyme Elp3 [Candidatus Woesebacteria bacterium]|nr:tRNA uridine(34) 5-carboxymethylaminomethyl modification radical SAM/GNAT enzyme Elp3 [Candidatus Woesebacteria bacterium]